jgi:molybdopterin converting factor small subunit
VDEARVRVLAFARIRELLGAAERELRVPPDARVSDVFAALARSAPALAELEGSTRIARNGRLATPDEPVSDGDEIALLPPFGGG